MSQLLRAALIVFATGVLSLWGTMVCGPWSASGPADIGGWVFMVAAIICVPLGALLLLAWFAGSMFHKLVAHHEQLEAAAATTAGSRSATAGLVAVNVARRRRARTRSASRSHSLLRP